MKIRPHIVPHIEKLVSNSQLVTIRIVFDELEHNHQPVYDLFEPFKKRIVVSHRDNQKVIDANTRICNEHPKLFNRFSTGNPADPFLIAVAMVNDYEIVSDESKKRQKYRRIPWIAEQYGVRTINWKEFLINTDCGFQIP